MTKPAIRVQGLSKRYRLGQRGGDAYKTLRGSMALATGHLFDRLRRKATNLHESGDFWALKDASFEVQPGEVVGIIGRNGAGKSTLLKILSRIVEPSSGRAEIHGRISSLLEVGTGFHPELTGRENIYLNGAILGMRREEISSKFDEIVAFSEIEQFLDTPVKRYSSGMYVRLAFAVAAHLEPEILVVDEVLAVGDLSFQKKCLGRMQSISKGGRTVIFVSHNLSAVENLCTRGILLEGGTISCNGSQTEAIARYSSSLKTTSKSANGWVHFRKQGILYNREPHLIAARVVPLGDNPNGTIRMGMPFRIEVAFFAPYGMTQPGLGVGINAMGGLRVTTLHSSTNLALEAECLSGTQVFSCDLVTQSLVPGDYSLKLSFEAGASALEVIDDAVTFAILPSDYFGNGQTPFRGLVALPQQWSIASRSPIIEHEHDNPN